MVITDSRGCKVDNSSDYVVRVSQRVFCRLKYKCVYNLYVTILCFSTSALNAHYSDLRNTALSISTIFWRLCLREFRDFFATRSGAGYDSSSVYLSRNVQKHYCCDFIGNLFLNF